MADPHISHPPLGPPLSISVVVPQVPQPMGPPPRPTDNQDASLRRSSRRRLARPPESTISQDLEAPARSHHSSSRTSSSSSHKRKLSEASPSRRTSSSPSLRTQFSLATKRNIEERYGEDGGCWHCGLPSAIETAHVLGASKREVFQELHHLGLLNIERLSHEDNGIRLCVLCHRSLDYTEQAWAFIPKDLEYFIQFEKEDRLRRMEIYRSTGSLPKRECPSTSQYLDRGGFYRSYMRRNFLHQGVAYEARFRPGPSRVQPNATWWHGDPMVTLHRAFLLVNILPPVFPDDVIDTLFALSRLYRCNDRVPSPPINVRPSTSDEQSRSSGGSNDSNDDRGKKLDKGRTSYTQGTPQSNLQRQTEKSSTTEKIPPNSSSDRRQSSRIQNQVNRQALLERRREQDEARRLLQDPPHKKLRREILDGTWKWGPLSSSNMAALAFRRNRQREKKGSDGPRSHKKIGITAKAKLASRLEGGLLSPETS